MEKLMKPLILQGSNLLHPRRNVLHSCDENGFQTGMTTSDKRRSEKKNHLTASQEQQVTNYGSLISSITELCNGTNLAKIMTIIST